MKPKYFVYLFYLFIIVTSSCESAKGENTLKINAINANEEYLDESPMAYQESPYVEADGNKIEQLVFSEKQHENTIEAYKIFLGKNPNGILRDEDEKRIAEFELRFYKEAREMSTLDAYQFFVKIFPNGKYSNYIKLLMTNFFNESNQREVGKFYSIYPIQRGKAAAEVKRLKKTLLTPYLYNLQGDHSPLSWVMVNGFASGHTSPHKEAEKALELFSIPDLTEKMLNQKLKPSDRNDAATLLSELNVLQSLNPFILALQDPDPGVRLIAAQSLGSYRDKRAILPLFDVLKDPDDEVAKTGGNSLLKMEDLIDNALLKKSLKDTNDRTRWAAVYIYKERSDPDILEDLIAAVKDNYVWVRANAATALGNLQDTRATKPLIMLLKDNELSVRYMSAEALGHLPITPEGEKALISCQEDEDSRVRWIALQSLLKLNSSQGLKITIAQVKDTGNRDRRNLVKFLGETRHPDAENALIEMIHDNSYWSISREACEALGKMKSIKAVNPLIEILKEQSGSSSQYAVEPLGEIGDTRAAAPLLDALEDPKTWYQMKHARVFVKLGVNNSLVQKRILKMLSSDEYKIRQAAVFLAGNLSLRSAEPLLIKLLEDEKPAVRMEAVDALKTIGSQAAVVPLTDFALDHEKNFISRVKALEALEILLKADDQFWKTLNDFLAMSRPKKE